MLPEEAWGLQIGEAVYVQTPDQPEPIYGHVRSVLSTGFSYQEYLALDYTDMDARRFQYDGPTVMVAPICPHQGSKEIHCRPDSVYRVLGDYTLMCATCGVVVVVKLPLRILDKMVQREPPDFALENVDPIHKAMILQSRCGEHVCIP